MPCPLTPDFLASNLDTVKGELDRVSRNQEDHHRTSQIGKLMHLVPPPSTYAFGGRPTMLFTVVFKTPKYVHLKMTYDDVLKYEETIDLLKKSLEHEPTDELQKNERKELLEQFPGIRKFLSTEQSSTSQRSGEKVIVFGCQHIHTSPKGEVRPLMFDIQRIHH